MTRRRLAVHLARMFKSGRHIGTIIFILVASGLGQAMADDRPLMRVAVVQSQDSLGPKASLQAIQAAVVQSLSELSVETVPTGLIPRAASACKGAECADLKGAAEATHVLVVRARYADEAFVMSLELWATNTKTLEAREARDCAICDLKDFEQAAHALAASVIGDRRKQPTPAEATLDPPLGPAPVVVSEQSASVGASVARWVGIAASIALIGGGIYYLGKDGDPSCRSGEVAPCDRVRETTVGSVALIGAGILVGASAIVLPMLVSDRDGNQLAGVMASGHF